MGIFLLCTQSRILSALRGLNLPNTENLVHRDPVFLSFSVEPLALSLELPELRKGKKLGTVDPETLT